MHDDLEKFEQRDIHTSKRLRCKCVGECHMISLEKEDLA